MKVIVAGHHYELESHEPGAPQVLQFIHKDKAEDSLPLAFQTKANGTTTEEVLACLIDRTQHLNRAVPCRENSIAITKMEEALLWLNKRTADLQQRKVEGTPHP